MLTTYNKQKPMQQKGGKKNNNWKFFFLSITIKKVEAET